MTRNFEKYFPLPFRVHIFKEKLLNKVDTLTVYAANGSYLWSSRIANRFDAFKYMVTCANLMPEAVEVINELLPYCMHGQKRVRAERFLAKLEGGGGE